MQIRSWILIVWNDGFYVMLYQWINYRKSHTMLHSSINYSWSIKAFTITKWWITQHSLNTSRSPLKRSIASHSPLFSIHQSFQQGIQTTRQFAKYINLKKYWYYINLIWIVINTDHFLTSILNTHSRLCGLKYKIFLLSFLWYALPTVFYHQFFFS
jgi:hypothetical protein